MESISIPNGLFAKVKREAKASGLTVSEFVSRIIALELKGDEENFDHLFTPEVVAELKQISDEIDAGASTLSMKESRLVLAESRAEWLKKNAG